MESLEEEAERAVGDKQGLSGGGLAAASAGPKSGIVAWQIIRAKGRCFYTGSGRAAAAAIGVR